MKCLSPLVVENKKYRSMKIHNPNMTRFLTVPCGHCVNCLKNILVEWSVRLEHESNISDTSFFVTLTYDDEHLPVDGVSLRDVQLFHKRIRKAGFDFKYCLISEYGAKFGRPHYHALYFNLPEYVFSEFWDKGFANVKDVIPQRICYVASFHILKNYFVPAGKNPNFRICSHYIGLDYFRDKELINAKINEWQYLVNNSGFLQVMPRYYKKKFDVRPVYRVPEISKGRTLVQARNYNSAIQINLKNFLDYKMKTKQL